MTYSGGYLKGDYFGHLGVNGVKDPPAYLGQGYDEPAESYLLPFWNIEPQSFPASVAESNALFAGAVEAGWAMQEAAGGTTLADFTAAAALTLTKNGAATKVLLGQPAVGLFDGASFKAQKALEIGGAATTSDNLALGSTATLSHTWVNPWSVLVVFRTAEPGSATHFFVTKPGSGNLWEIYLNSGYVSVYISDTTGHNVSKSSTTGGHSDGSWHWAYVRFDPVSDVLSIDTDLTTGATASTAALVTIDDTAGAFTVGKTGAGAPVASVQIRGLIVFSDVATTVASIQAWWRHAAVPSWITSYTRASSFASVVADDATTGDVLRTVATGKYAVGYNSPITTNPLKLGIECWPAGTNLLPDSNVNLTASWVNTTAGTGATALYDADSPRGFREAIKHTKAAAGDMSLTAAAKGAAVTAASVYTASVWCKWDGTNTAPVLQVYRADGTTLIGAVSATNGTSLWRRLSYSFTAPATETVRVAVMGASAAGTAGSAWFACPMVNTEDFAKPWVQTTGATAATAAIVPYVIVPELTSDYGSIKVWCVVNSTAATKVLAAVTSTAGGTTTKRQLQLATATTFGFLANAATAALGAAATDLYTVESIASCLWDVSARAGYNKRVARLPSDISGAAATENTALETVGADTYLNIGHIAGASQLGGVVSDILVRRGVVIE